MGKKPLFPFERVHRVYTEEKRRELQQRVCWWRKKRRDRSSERESTSVCVYVVCACVQRRNGSAGEILLRVRLGRALVEWRRSARLQWRSKKGAECVTFSALHRCCRSSLRATRVIPLIN